MNFPTSGEPCVFAISASSAHCKAFCEVSFDLAKLLGFGRVVGSGIIVKFSVSAIRLEFAQYALVTPSEALCEGWCNLVNVGCWAVAGLDKLDRKLCRQNLLICVGSSTICAGVYQNTTVIIILHTPSVEPDSLEQL